MGCNIRYVNVNHALRRQDILGLQGISMQKLTFSTTFIGQKSISAIQMLHNTRNYGSIYGPWEPDTSIYWNKKNETFDLISWNCALSPWADSGLYRSTLQELCREGNAALDIMLVLVLLEAVILGLHFWTWRRSKNVQDSAVADERIGRLSAEDLS